MSPALVKEKDMERKNQTLRMLKNDLPLLASNSAIELDGLQRHKNIQSMDALKTLIEKIRDMMPIDELIKDPARTPVVGTRDLLIIKNAIITSQVGSQGKKVTEVILDAKEVVQRLRSISVNPQKAKSKDIQQMRQFCLSLSEAASAGQPSPFKDRNRYFGRR